MSDLGKFQHYKNKKIYITLGEAKQYEMFLDRRFVKYIAWHTEAEPTRLAEIYFDGENFITTEDTDMVVYTCGDGKIWARPKQMFYGDVEHEGVMMKRFTPIEE